MKEKVLKDKTLFAIHYLLRAISIGGMFSLFNIFMIDVGFSAGFLGLFLSIGNITMAFSSIPLGFLIDKFDNKKFLLIMATTLLSFCMLLEITIKNQSLLIGVSIVYGIVFMLQIVVSPLLLMEISKKESNVVTHLYSFNLIGKTVGSLGIGILISNLLPIFTSLLLMGIIQFLSVVPLFLIDYKKALVEDRKEKSLGVEKSKEVNTETKMKRMSTSLFLMLILFVCLGSANILENFLNLYFLKRYSIDASTSIIISSIIFLLIGITMYFLSNKIKTLNNRYRTIILFVIIGSNIFLIFFNNLWLQVILIVINFSSIFFFTGDLNEQVLRSEDFSEAGKTNGIINMALNLSETIGIYISPVLIQASEYNVAFVISMIMSLIAYATYLKFGKMKR
ncbi:MFS transporter [Enterococcus ureasiticus]|uniref:MFS transporter n=1 Tax=Enterococcus ureasiticus TaxID=903984 RepID=UPI001A8FE046|nr:MFS transporter [Enterococcus ureasiticus]MBO0474398.1 MFS transporter [Enterococcus ureasiticus]